MKVGSDRNRGTRGDRRSGSTSARKCVVRPYVLLWVACDGAVRPTLAAFNEGCSASRASSQEGEPWRTVARAHQTTRFTSRRHMMGLIGLDADATGRWAVFALAVESDARCPGQGVGEARPPLRLLRRRLQHLSAVPGRGRAGHGRRVRLPRPAAQADGERGQERGGPPGGAGLPGVQLYRRANAQAALRAAAPHCNPGLLDHIVLFSRVSPAQVLFRVVPQSTPGGVTRQILGVLAPLPYVIIWGTSKNAIFAHRRFRIGLTIC